MIRTLVQAWGRIRFNACLRISRYRALSKLFAWCQRGQATREEIDHALRLGPALSDVAAGYIAPIYWIDPQARLTAIPFNGTIFFLNCGGTSFAVTADHVYRAYLGARQAAPQIVCRIGNMNFDPANRLIDRNEGLDLATFRITEDEIHHLGKLALTGSQREWPPAPPWPGRGVFFAGYPGVAHILHGEHTIDFGIYAVNTIATEVTSELITCEFQRERWVDHLGLGLPEEGYNLSGLSGCPVLTLVDHRGILSWRLAGVTYSAPRYAGEMILVRRADFIREDGRLTPFSVRQRP